MTPWTVLLDLSNKKTQLKLDFLEFHGFGELAIDPFLFRGDGWILYLSAVVQQCHAVALAPGRAVWL